MILTHRYWILLLLVAINWTANGQSVQKGPYTVRHLTDGVYHIEDANDSNPAGIQVDESGGTSGMNNCSDIYLVVGRERAMLIDLSNAIRWDSTATESLRALVAERVGERELFITVTHNHADHLGMLPAFEEDEKISFWINGAEFEGSDRFPEKRTHYFRECDSLDLGGGFLITTFELPGHTAHSTLFFLKSRDLVFTGDAIGSGSGVWLFNEASFYTYRSSIDRLIRYLEEPAHGVATGRLVFHGGHSWQQGSMENLNIQYVYDMRTLIERMGQGIAETEEMSTFISFLDTNFRYGTATITWNREAAARYADSNRVN